MLLIVHVLQIAELGAYLLLYHDANLDKVSGVSPQTCVGLSVGASLSLLNVGFTAPLQYLCYAVLVMTAAWACSYKVSRKSDANSEDDLLVGDDVPLPSLVKKSLIYWEAAAMGTVAILFACRFSPTDLVAWAQAQPRGIPCTYQNFLHGTALLPQLLLSRRRGRVEPAATRFLLILGTKHLVELATDLYISYRHSWSGKLSLHEASFMAGDIFAAAVLIDFLYLALVVSPRRMSWEFMKIPSWIGAPGLALDV